MSITKVTIDFNNVLKDQYNNDFYDFNPTSVNKIVQEVNELIKLQSVNGLSYHEDTFMYPSNILDNLKQISKEFYQTKLKDILLVSIFKDRVDDTDLKTIVLIGNFISQLNINGIIIAEKDDFNLLKDWILKKKGLDSFIKYNLINHIDTAMSK